VADIVVGDSLDIAEAKGEERRGAIEGLDLALLIDAQNHGVIRGIEIEPDDIPHFLDEERIRRDLEMLLAMSVLLAPSAESNTMRARVARDCGIERERVIERSSSLSDSDNVSGVSGLPIPSPPWRGAYSGVSSYESYTWDRTLDTDPLLLGEGLRTQLRDEWKEDVKVIVATLVCSTENSTNGNIQHLGRSEIARMLIKHSEGLACAKSLGIRT
jgi:hypothetical protein